MLSDKHQPGENISNNHDSVQINYLPNENIHNNRDRQFEQYWNFLPNKVLRQENGDSLVAYRFSSGR